MTDLLHIKDSFKQAAKMLSTFTHDIDLWAERISGLLKELEQAHHKALAELADIIQPHDAALAGRISSSVNTALAGEPLAEHVDSELGFILYWLEHPHQKLQSLQAETAHHDGFAEIWQLFTHAAPSPAISQEDFVRVKNLITSSDKVFAVEDGTIIGFGKYEQLDPGWLWTAVNRVLNWLLGETKFQTTNDFKPVKLEANENGSVRIAVIGDWGTGSYDEHGPIPFGGNAVEVLQTVAKLKPDYIVHLGDTYYAGTNSKRPPANEESDNLVNLWREIIGPDMAGRCFTLNSNHEMYGGAEGLYEDALSKDLFEAQGGLTYFSLEFGQWLIGGFDSAYFSPSITYLLGGLGTKEQDPAQYKFLSDFKDYTSGKSMSTMLMCHHNAIDTFGTKPMEPLWSNVTETITPDYWYWGHIHLGAIYKENAPVWDKTDTKTKARCIGHSAIPIATPWGFEKAKYKHNVWWYANTPQEPNQGSDSILPEIQQRIKNGFAMVTLWPDGGILEETYDAGSTVPTYPTKCG